jgi:hypothetical protein
MKRFLALLIVIFPTIATIAQIPDSIEVYLLTCDPGLEIETVYGHSAIRVINHISKTDSVYSWGVYDFAAPHFAWNFAKGRLRYQVKGEPTDSFLEDYFLEQRSVISQKINLLKEEKISLIRSININLLPKNKFYLYDFFYDNCATKIRDLLEQTNDTALVYPIGNGTKITTFRKLVNEAQKPLPWLTFGTDLLIGIPGDKIADTRDQMFLPEYLMKNLSATRVSRNNKQITLLQDQVTLLFFKRKEAKDLGLFQPVWVFSILATIIILLSIRIHNGRFMLWLDRILFLVFVVLSGFQIFFNFITDHDATKMNLNIIWLNPILFIAFYSLFTNKKMFVWFKIIAITSLGFIIGLIFIPQSINLAFIPIMLILIVRSLSRSGLTPRRKNNSTDC